MTDLHLFPVQLLSGEITASAKISVLGLPHAVIGKLLILNIEPARNKNADGPDIPSVSLKPGMIGVRTRMGRAG